MTAAELFDDFLSDTSALLVPPPPIIPPAPTTLCFSSSSSVRRVWCESVCAYYWYDTLNGVRQWDTPSIFTVPSTAATSSAAANATATATATASTATASSKTTSPTGKQTCGKLLGLGSGSDEDYGLGLGFRASENVDDVDTRFYGDFYEAPTWGSQRNEFSSPPLPNERLAVASHRLDDPITADQITKDLEANIAAVTGELNDLLDRNKQLDITLSLLEDQPAPIVFKLEDATCRRNVIECLCMEEKHFVSRTKIAMAYFRQIHSTQIPISVEEMAFMMSNVEALQLHHQGIAEAILKRLSTWKEETTEVGDLYQRNNDWISLYEQFINGFGLCVGSFDVFKKRYPEFRAFLEHALDELEFPVELALIDPLHRFSKYSFFIEKLLQFTHEHHPDYPKLLKASSFMIEMDAYAHSFTPNIEDVLKLFDISKLICAPPSAPHLLQKTWLVAMPQRKYLRDGLMIVNNDDVHMWLFSDILVITKRENASKKYEFIDEIELSKCSLEYGDTRSVFLLFSPNSVLKCETSVTTQKNLSSSATASAISSTKRTWALEISEACASARKSMFYTGFQLTDGTREERVSTLIAKLLATESTYIEELEKSHDIFVRPLKANPVTNKHPLVVSTCALFENLLQTHTVFCEKMASAKPSNAHLMETFHSTGAYSSYSDYVLQFQSDILALIDIQKTQSDTSMGTVLNNLDEYGGFPLSVALTQPLKRGTDYLFVFQQLTNLTPITEPEHDRLLALAATITTLIDLLFSSHVVSIQTIKDWWSETWGCVSPLPGGRKL
ncbi:hypothetical protein Pelo_10997 [Pelomyxa schiedti]|nr:hypothetical protein Pelo_10997 [Pelomyxa schiedti]